MQIIAHLDRNATAYDKIMKEETILTHRNETIEKYFSFGDDVGSGKLKERIRIFLGMDRFDFVGQTYNEGHNGTTKTTTAGGGGLTVNNITYTFCMECIFSGMTTCKQRAEYFVKQYNVPIQDALQKTVEQWSKCGRIQN